MLSHQDDSKSNAQQQNAVLSGRTPVLNAALSPVEGWGSAAELRPGSKAKACSALIASTEASLPAATACSAWNPAAY